MGDEVEVCRGHGGDPQGDEAWSLQYNQGGRCVRASGRVHGKGCRGSSALLPGYGLLPTLQRRMSRQDSRGNTTRKSSTMEELDIPMPRRIIETIETPALAKAALSF